MNKTYQWWLLLCVIAAVNIGLWCWAVFTHYPDTEELNAQLILSSIYVFVCAFRSVYPRIDLERYCLFDTPLSSIALGRTLATIAEVAFSIQCALLLADLAVLLDSALINTIAYSVVPIIVIAQCFCWYAVLKLDHFWHCLEEIAWVVMVLLAAGCFISGVSEVSGITQQILILGCLACFGSGYIMLMVDVPMYWGRSQHRERKAHASMTWQAGISDVLTRREVTDDWGVWRKEALWLTAYFTLGVWLSLGMVFLKLS
nr:hypothetical protein KPDKLGBK_00002 [uncultured bacterium]